MRSDTYEAKVLVDKNEIVDIWGQQLNVTEIEDTFRQGLFQISKLSGKISHEGLPDWLELEYQYKSEGKRLPELGLIFVLVDTRNGENERTWLDRLDLHNGIFKKDLREVLRVLGQLRTRLMEGKSGPWVRVKRTERFFNAAIGLFGCCRGDDREKLTDKEIRILLDYIFRTSPRAEFDINTKRQKMLDSPSKDGKIGVFKYSEWSKDGSHKFFPGYVPESWSVRKIVSFLLSCNRLPTLSEARRMSRVVEHETKKSDSQHTREG